MSAPIGEEALRRELVAASRALHARGWVANHDGNISARLEGERLLCTPTALSKGDVAPELLIVVDADNRVVAGTRKPFSELLLHRAAYAARPDIGVVLHAHPPTATGFAVAGQSIGHPFMAEPVVSLGPELPLLPYRLPGAPEASEDLGRALERADVVLLGGHGVLSVGGSVEQALLRMELVEHLARIALVARQLGGPQPLPEADVAALSAKGRPPSSPSWGEAPRAEEQASWGPPPSSGGRPDLRGLVDEALRRLR